jgi:glycine dehydrogenase subunit 1
MPYIANTESQQKEMLEKCGVSSIKELFKDIPAELAPKSFDLPKGKSEYEVISSLKKMANVNYSHLTNFLGAGFYDHFIPEAVNALSGRSEFYTAYTPYQPELSQGTLQSIFEYQSHICRLTGLDVSNASMYDGGTALYEACQIAIAASRHKRNRIVIDGGVNPIYREMIASYTKNLNIELCEISVSHGTANRQKIEDSLDDNTAAVILQNPNFFGVMDDHSDIAEICHKNKTLVIQSVNPIAISLLKSPAEIGADIAVGEGQSLGIPLSFGGPYLGFLAVTKKLARQMPGRIAGKTVDRNGKDGFVLTLQAREQHIRREKATSNICSNQALMALRANIYLSLLGKEGLKEVATLSYRNAHYAKDRFKTIDGVEVMESSPTFNEFTLRLPMDAGEVAGRMIDLGFAAGFPLGRYYKGMENYLLVAVTEKRTKNEIGRFAEALEEALCQ